MQESKELRPRTLMLAGGAEWLPGGEAADRWWLSRSQRAEVTVLAAANRVHPDLAVQLAERYFASLGAEVTECPIHTPEDGRLKQHLSQLRSSAAVYLAGGDPGWLRQVLLGSPVGSVLRQLYLDGIPLAGSSAGAMVLGGFSLLPGEGMTVEPSLGLAPGMGVIPHWDKAGVRWKQAADELGRHCTVVAIDEHTAVCWDGAQWAVRGAGKAVVLADGRELTLDQTRLGPPLE